MNRLLIAMALALLLGISGASGQVIEWEVIAGGGRDMTGGGIYMNGTVSQTADILAIAGGLEVGQGFWYRAGARGTLASAIAGIQWYVIAGGGGQGAQNSSFRLNGTVSQTADILAASVAHQAGQGFWYNEPDLPLYKIQEEESVEEETEEEEVTAGQYTTARATMSIAPNPVAGHARIILRLPGAAHVRIAIFDEIGNIVGNAFEGSLDVGEQEVYFDGTHIPAGVYFVRMESDTEVVTKKITIIR